MTTTAPLPAAASLSPASGATSLPARRPQEGPGRLRIEPRVVQKLAAQAAREVDGVIRASVAPLSRAVNDPVPAGTPPDQLSIHLELAVGIRYPRSVRATVEEVAAHVSRRVEQLIGRPVDPLHVRVSELGGRGSEPPRVR